jgi:thioredoxin-like negative regulator of GroEL
VVQVPFYECDTETDASANAAATRLGVRALPTTILVRYGSPFARIEGAVEAIDVIAKVRSIFADVLGGAAWPAVGGG